MDGLIRNEAQDLPEGDRLMRERKKRLKEITVGFFLC